MKTLATLLILAVLAIVGCRLLSAGQHTVTKVRDAYTTVQDMQDEQDAIFAKGAK